ncbi:MAG: DMT family transporter [Candidatus Kapabacteria bacterium]|nr:DMT family transporter [Candidatus Kapabacteria bacterium]
MNTEKKAYILAAFAILFWSTVASAFKIGLKELNPIQLLCFSSIFSLIIFLIFIVTTKKIYLLRGYSKKEILSNLAMGALNPFLYYLILFKAYSLLPAQEALTLNYTWALAVALLSIPILKQKISILTLTGLLISFFGVIIIATKGRFNLEFSNTLGVVLALSSSLVWASYWTINTRNKIDGIIGLFLNFCSGTALILIYLLIFDEMPQYSTISLLSCVYIGTFEMGVTFVLWSAAMKVARNAATLSSYVYLSPFLSLFFISIVIGEKILLSSLAGLCFIIAGIFISRYRRK